MFGQFLRRGKDVALAEGARLFVNNSKFKKYGIMNTLQIDTDNKKINFSVALKGEEKQIDGEVSYHLEETTGMMVTDSVKFSREWLTEVFNDFVPPDKRRFALPPFLAKVLGL